MSGVPDTLIAIEPRKPRVDELRKVKQDIDALYPPDSARPCFELTDVVKRDGRTFVRLATLAGSLHLWLRRSAKLGQFSRPVLFSWDRDSGEFEDISSANKTVQRTGASRSARSRNRTSPATGSRR
jgi:hypothetical protein